MGIYVITKRAIIKALFKRLKGPFISSVHIASRHEREAANSWKDADNILIHCQSALKEDARALN